MICLHWFCSKDPQRIPYFTYFNKLSEGPIYKYATHNSLFDKPEINKSQFTSFIKRNIMKHENLTTKTTKN